MKKLKKIIALLAVFGLGLSSLVALVPIMPERTEAALFSVKLNEFMPNPSSGSEWVEVYNPNSTPVDISGYKLDDEAGGGSVFTIPGGTVVGGYGFYLKERSYGFDDAGSDEARLLDPADTVVDSYPFTGTTDGKTYSRSIDGAGAWSDGTTEPTKGKSNDITVPTPGTVIDGLGAIDAQFIATLSSISANWSGFNDLESVLIGYRYSVTGSDSSTPVPWTKVGPEINSFTESVSLTEGVVYTVKVKAQNNAALEVEASSNGQTPDLTGPTKPSSLVINPRNVKDNEVKLSWDASTDGGSGVDAYEIWRSVSPWEKIGEVEELTTNFTDVIGEGVLDDVWVEYKIIAKDELENPSTDSNIAGTSIDTTAPGAPVISFSFINGLVNLTWQPVAGASTYDVYRDGVIVQSGTIVGYTDKSSQGGETHRYYVQAADGAGNISPISNTLEVYIPKPQVSSISTSQVLDEITGAEIVQAAEPQPEQKVEEGKGEIKAEDISKPEETAEAAKTNWSLIIAIIIAAAIVVAGVLYWWYAREEEEDEI